MFDRPTAGGSDVARANQRPIASWASLAVGLLLALGSSGCVGAPVTPSSTEDVLQRLLPSSVQIVLERDGRRFRSGSGTIIAANEKPGGAECWVLSSGHTLARGT